MDRPYQTRTIEAIRSKCANGVKRILVVAPTGSGKGYVAARVMEMCASKQNANAFFAAQRELIFQIGKQLSRLDVPCNVVMAGVQNEYESSEDHLQGGLCSLVAKDTLWSRAFRSKKMEIPPAKVIQIDECHMSLSQTYQSIMDFYSESICIGWTATPCRTDGKSLGNYYDTMIQSATYAELQAQGYLVPLKVFAPDRPDLKGLKVSRGDYSKSALEQRMNRDEMVGNIVREWNRRADGRSTVAFLSGIQHSIHTRNEFRKLLGTNTDGTHRVEHIDGKMENSERADIMGRAADGRVLVLCNYGVLHTGVDVPQWKYLICARPTKSFGLWRQMGGRIQRPYPGHDHACIQDHSDNCLHFGYPDEDVEWSLAEDVVAQDLPRTERNKPEGVKKEPYRCEKCQTEYRGPHCPSCGHVPEHIGKDVKMSKGDLEELERRRCNKDATPMDKQKFWDQALGIAIQKGSKVGAAAHIYRGKFGVFPNSSIQGVPRLSQWQMTARDFYFTVVKPERDAAKIEAQMQFSGIIND